MTRTRKLTWISISAAVLSVTLMHLHLRRFERRATGGEPVAVVGLAGDLGAGTTLEASMLTVQRIPERYVESRHIPSDQRSTLVGLRIARALRGNETLLWSDMAGLSHRDRRLSQLVPHGMRAMSIQPSGGIARLVRPGDRVDVLCTPRAGATSSGNPGGHTRTVLENLLVLARGDDLGDRPGASARSSRGGLTLGVRQQDSRRLADARGCASLHVTLRHPDDFLTTVAKVAETPTTGGRDD